MPTKKQPAKKTASEKSEADAPVKFDVKVAIEGLVDRIDLVVGRLKSLETTVDAIRREYKSKGVPMP